MTLQCTMACPGLANHTLAGLSGYQVLPPPLEITTHRAKPHHPQTTSPSLLEPPEQAPPNLLLHAEAAFDLAVPHDMPRAGQSHTGRALCILVAERCLLIWKYLQTGGQNHNPHKPPAQCCRSPQCRLHNTCCKLQKLHLTLQWHMACPVLATHALAGLCTLWLLSGTCTSARLQH